MSQNASGASTVVAFPGSLDIDTDPVRRQRRAKALLARIEDGLSLAPGAFAAALKDGKPLPEDGSAASGLTELVALYGGLCDEDRQRCLAFVRSLAKRP